ncbi:MAG: TonB-dependent receptor [Spongiibacteraceae bacterium]|nr:TonB-dependent receptor [Spongiibacteraceae bacterium]MBN4055363.1 TonB-dependent receptor [bacterium AH-315-K03]
MFAPVSIYHLSSALIVFSVTSMTFADHEGIEELLITDSQDRRHIDVAHTLEIAPDAASLLRKAPGANVNGNGPLSGIAQYRGMYGARVNVEVNGMTLSSGGPNWMDPPLHYAPAAQLDSLEVYRGIAPVSAGQETIGGVVNAKTWDGEFGSGEQFESSGRIRSGGQSVNDATVLSVALVEANQHHRIKLSALTESAEDAEFSDGHIRPSEYRRDRYDIGYGYQNGAHSWRIDLAKNETGDSGTPALPMDIIYVDSELASMQYRYDSERGASVSAKIYYSDIDHGMSNHHLRAAPMNNGMWRRNTAHGDNIGFKLSTEIKDDSGDWLLGVDAHREIHNSDIDNPKSANFFVTNFNEAKREILGLFVERTQNFSENLSVELGLRTNQVTMDADKVDATPSQMMPPAQMLRDNFNNSDRSITDNNIDAVAKLYYRSDNTMLYYLGVARKTRSPSYQERYLWLPLQSTGGLGDGRTYTGNLNLNPEVALEMEFGFDFSSAKLTVSPRFFYRDIEDYIQGTVSTNMSAVMFVAMMSGGQNTAPLAFNNVDAQLYGFDMDWVYQLGRHWSLNGLFNYVRGKRDDINDDLYRIAPANASLALNYQQNSWALRVESRVYAEQDKVSITNGEQETAGYGIVALKGYWQFNEALRLGVGVENVFDKYYEDHLGGYNRASNPDIAQGDHLPGYERSVFARVDFNW